MKIQLTADQLRIFRLRANHLLHAPDDTPSAMAAKVLEEILGVQAQDLPAGMLSMRARAPQLTAADVEGARQEERSIAWNWFMRGTLHLLASTAARWVLPLLVTVRIHAGETRLKQVGWDEQRTDHATKLLIKHLQGHGPQTHAEIRLVLKEHNLPFEGQAPVHLLYRMAYQGDICRGPDRGHTHTYTLSDDWLGKAQPLPQPEALAQLAERYLAAYAPATVQDFATWSGLPAGDAQKGWQMIQEKSMSIEAAGEPAWILKHQQTWLDEKQPEHPFVNLLPRFDTFLLGYTKRDLMLEPSTRKKYNSGGGIANAVVLVDGQVRAIWRLNKQRSCQVLTVEPFTPLPKRIWSQIETEISDISRFLDTEVVLSAHDDNTD